MKNRKSHDIVEQGLPILHNLDHRGAVGADPKMGDGCGILVQIPHKFFAAECAKVGIWLPEEGQYGVGHLFMPRDPEGFQLVEEIVTKAIADEGLQVLGWREVPVDSSDLGESVKATEPQHRQIFVGKGKGMDDPETFERRLFIARKVISNAVYDMKDPRTAGYYPVSLSSRTIVYKGMVLVTQLGDYYLDLQDARFESAIALVHQRFATNTFPTWQLAHPYRMVAHNGEINTLRGNVNWMAARQASVDSELFGNDISKLWPISYEGQSDTACFDNALEFLVRGGYSLAHAMMMLIPEAWAGNPLMNDDRRAFYEYHAALMEPWDGPAAVCFTDGKQIGATLDRNGLRPARYLVTDDGLVVLASEMGVLPIPEEKIVEKWRLQPGKMLLIDLEEGRIVSDDEIKQQLSNAHPYKEWLKRTQIVLEDLKPVQARESRTDVSLLDRQQAFGYTAGRPQAAHAAHGRHRPGSGRLHGIGHADLRALRQVEAALHLFQAELRPGDEPADRPDPRRARHEPGVVHRPAPEHPRSRRHLAPQAPGSAPADPHQRGSGEDPLHRPFRGSLRHQDPRHHLCMPSSAQPPSTARSTASATARKQRCMAATTSSS